MTSLAESQTQQKQRTRYLKSIKQPSLNMLKPGKQNAKLGDKVQVKMWQGLPMYSLTLEERRSCPDHCEQWDNCYGNNMPFAHRFDHTHPDFYTNLEANILALLAKHEQGIVVRLHVLGDFFSVKYVLFWFTLLVDHPNLHIFGYVHHRKNSDIGSAIDAINKVMSDQCRIRFSDDNTTEFNATVIASDQDSYEGIICPEQTGRTASCTTCGYCWASDKPVNFLAH